MGTFTNSEDELPQNVAFHPGLNCLIKQKDLKRKL